MLMTRAALPCKTCASADVAPLFGIRNGLEVNPLLKLGFRLAWVRTRMMVTAVKMSAAAACGALLLRRRA